MRYSADLEEMSFEFIFINKSTGYFLEQEFFSGNGVDLPPFQDQIQSSSGNLKKLDLVIRNYKLDLIMHISIAYLEVTITFANRNENV